MSNALTALMPNTASEITISLVENTNAPLPPLLTKSDRRPTLSHLDAPTTTSGLPSPLTSLTTAPP
jgi:hypothetical protein